MTIKEFLTQTVNNWAAIGHPALMERFILRNGKEYTAQPYTGKRGTPKQCYENATHLHVGTYAEGYMWRGDLPILIQHAWRVLDGKVIDPTLDRPEECQYMGIELDAGELFKELDRNKVYGVLDFGHGINHEFMFKRDPELRAIVDSIMSARRPAS